MFAWKHTSDWTLKTVHISYLSRLWCNFDFNYPVLRNPSWRSLYGHHVVNLQRRQQDAGSGLTLNCRQVANHICRLWNVYEISWMQFIAVTELQILQSRRACAVFFSLRNELSHGGWCELLGGVIYLWILWWKSDVVVWFSCFWLVGKQVCQSNEKYLVKSKTKKKILVKKIRN